MRAPCEGAGLTAIDTQYQTTVCPVCKAIAAVDRDGTIDPHTVLVIGD